VVDSGGDGDGPAKGDGGQFVVRLENLEKTYFPSSGLLNLLVRSTISVPVHALAGVDLELKAGEIKAIVGPNGAGKTTLFRILVGLTTPTAGSARVLGFDPATQAEQARHRLGFMPSDDRSLFMRLTCAENLRFHGRIHGLRGKALDVAIGESLERVDLAARHDSSVFSLSAGMRARLQLARATLHRPTLLILDEPTAAIDPVASHHLLRLLVDLVADEQMGALISSHRLEEIEALSTDVLLLDRGKVRFDGNLDELRPLDRPIVELVFRSPDAAARAARLLVSQAEVDCIGAMLECTLRSHAGTGSLLAALGPELQALDRCRERPLPLRDLLAQVYRAPVEPTGISS
jgi:ABC-2 type transport system ATP-binding protein